jgi:energy-coupling factor transport system substrate-specific component
MSVSTPAAVEDRIRTLPGARRPYWETRELVTIGIFAAVIKVSSLLIAYIGGGMNPVSLFLKNAVYVTLLVVLVHKVPRRGTLILATFISSLMALLVMGQSAHTAISVVLAGVVGEGIIWLLGGYGSRTALLGGVFVQESFAKGLGLLMTWLVLREQPGLVLTVSVFVAIGYLGSLAGLVMGVRFVKELRHAGIVLDD